MGSNNSILTAETFTNDIANIFNERLVDITMEINQSNLIRVGLTMGDVKLFNVDMENNQILNYKDIDKSSFQSGLESKINDYLEQKAKSQSDGGFEFIANKNFQLIVTNIQKQITKREFVKNICKESQDNTIRIDYSTGITIGFLNMKNSINTIKNLIYNSDTLIKVDDAIQIKQIQTSDLKGQGKFNLGGKLNDLLKTILIPAAIILGVFLLLSFALSFYKARKVNTPPKKDDVDVDAYNVDDDLDDIELDSYNEDEFNEVSNYDDLVDN